jgi:16S rRNA (cytidine1402-2'-O)-methyltransferase
MKKAELYVVATPIGNQDDITLRALQILKTVDFVICEERKEGSKLLKSYGLQKPLECLNEHNENEMTPILLKKILIDNQTAALISDAGTPLFADPGNRLVRDCLANNIPVIPVPGASSVMAALMMSGLQNEQFLYYGFLPANKQERLKAIKLLPLHLNIVFLEAPYRLKPFLRDLITGLSGKREAIIAYKITQPQEKIFWGTLKELQIQTQNLPKGEFVFILKGKHGKKR